MKKYAQAPWVMRPATTWDLKQAIEAPEFYSVLSSPDHACFGMLVSKMRVVTHDPQVAATCRLVLTAPALLEALEWLVDELGDPAKPKVPSVEAMQAARTAVAQATVP